jgi:L-alanine-DL-glutamate epimerase-like enolase superfamily enzyme
MVYAEAPWTFKGRYALIAAIAMAIAELYGLMLNVPLVGALQGSVSAAAGQGR